MNLEERLKEAIQKCEDVEKGVRLPFEVNADEILELVKVGYEQAKSIEELCLDARLLRKFVMLIYSQTNWLKYEADELYLDVGLVKEKLGNLPLDALYEIFLECWHPIVELEQLTHGALKIGFEHWEEIPSPEIREVIPLRTPSAISSEEAIARNIIPEKNFSKNLEKFWKKLKGAKKLQYSEFIKDKSFEKTVKKAFLISFLLTYGYATLKKEKGRTYLIPFSKKKEISEGESIAITIGRES